MELLHLETTNPVDLEIIQRHDPRVRRRGTIEVAVVRHLLAMLTDAGYHFICDDGEDSTETDDHDKLVKQIFGVDESRLWICHGETGKQGSIFIVLGNDGWDLICDYSSNLSDILDPYLDWLNEQQEQQ